MGICYKLIMLDDFDFDYGNGLEDFEKEWDGYIERIARWYSTVVYDVDKSSPFMENRLKLISEYCDLAYYQHDHNLGIVELDLPRKKTYLEGIENRRTPEEKKASEDYARQRLKDMGYE
jgi:hypothetical protein